ncbi:MAG: hypothetical protein KDC95_23965, partial [Planctomycetes bacterium]|nr:hypothetical protein [Planctomycetota bacterium]
MPLEAATNCWTEQEDRLIESIAQSAQFQTWVGAANTTEAKAHIHVEFLPPPADRDHYTPQEVAALVPFALIVDAADQAITFDRACQDVGQFYFTSGRKLVMFCARVNAEADTYPEAIRKLKNVVGKIILEMNDLAGNDDTADYIRAALAEPVSMAKDQHRHQLKEAIQAVW